MILVKRFQVVRDNILNDWLTKLQSSGGKLIDIKYTGDSALAIYEDVGE